MGEFLGSGAWAPLAEGDWRHRLEVSGATPLASDNGLEDQDGVYTWFTEQVFRTHTGVWLFVRAARREGAPDDVVIVAGADEDDLVTAVQARLGITPGRVETLGRAGIEIGLEPGDEIED